MINAARERSTSRTSSLVLDEADESLRMGSFDDVDMAVLNISLSSAKWCCCRHNALGRSAGSPANISRIQLKVTIRKKGPNEQPFVRPNFLSSMGSRNSERPLPLVFERTKQRKGVDHLCSHQAITLAVS